MKLIHLFLQPKPFPLLWWITAAYSARLAGGHLAIALPFGILSKLLCLKIQQDLTFSSQNSLKSVILENTTGYVDNGLHCWSRTKEQTPTRIQNIIFSCSFVINSRLTKTEDMSFVRQLFSALSISAWGYHKFGICAAPVVKTKSIVAYFNF